MPSMSRPSAFCHALKALIAFLTVASPLAPSPAHADEALVAVAANFAEVVEKLEAMFEASSGHTLTTTTGSTGKLYAQITKGAPFDVLLAADQARPAKLEAGGFAVAGSRFTYAVGRLSLWSPDPERIGADGLATLRAADFDHLAIANPDLAPYGRAARQMLTSFALWDALAPRIVMGENVGQTFSMVATGNAELGLVAKSYAISARNQQPGSRWDVPADAHDPIRQDAVLLQADADNAAAAAFLAFLHSDEARAAIESFGYVVE
jgi:molybdate transport system substrate-binding protein